MTTKLKEMVIENFENLSHGDKVYRCEDGKSRKLYFVGTDPINSDYCIFCDGTYLTHCYIKNIDTSGTKWFIGKYDPRFIGKVLIEQVTLRVKSIRHVYQIKETR